MTNIPAWTLTARRLLGFGVAIGVLFLASWILIPAPTYFLLTFGVGAREVSAWLAVGAVLAVALLAPDLRRHRSARIALVFAIAAFCLASIPFVRYPSSAPLAVTDLFRGIPLGDARVTRGIVTGTPDGQTLTVDVYRPTRTGHFPTVVQIYGGAWQRGQPGDNANFAHWLAARGYVVFAIDYRHAPSHRWPAQIDDVRADLAWIAAHAAEYDADTARVALIGRSAGAQLALIAAYTPGPLSIRGVVSYYGPTDLIDAYHNPPHPDPLRIRDVEETLMGGTPDGMPDRYRDGSPVTYATHALPPTLLVYGAHDHIVEPRYGERLHTRLLATGTTSVYLEIPWAEHAFDAVFRGPSSQLALYHTERFLASALSPR